MAEDPKGDPNILQALERLQKTFDAFILRPAGQPHGCVCPPGAEATCKGLACPRRGFDLTPR